MNDQPDRTPSPEPGSGPAQALPAIQFAALSTRYPRAALCSPRQIVSLCADNAHAACVLADPGFLAAMQPLSAAAREAGIHPVFGLSAALEPQARNQPAWPLPQDPSALFLARNSEGLSTLMELSWLTLENHSSKRQPRLDPATLRNGLTNGIAVLPIGARAIHMLADSATAALIPDTARDALDTPESRAALAAAAEHRLPAIPYLPIFAQDSSEMRREALAAIWADHASSTWEGALDALPAILHPLPAEELRRRYAHFPVLLANAARLAASCNAMPRSMLQPPPDAADSRLLATAAREGLAHRLATRNPPEEYLQRLETELDAISRAGWAGIFLAMRTFLDRERDRGVLIGPGRGSAAGSLVSWALGITVPDPIRHNLIFERFINPERVSPPDFDIDFPSHAQTAAQEALRDFWGRDRSAAVSGTTTYGERQAYLSSARARGVPYPRVERSLNALGADSGRAPLNPSEPRLKLAAMDARTLSVTGAAYAITRHPAGIVLAPEPWRGCIPAYKAPAGDTLQTDHIEAEQAGLVKIDVLSLATLDALELARQRSAGPHPWSLPDDPAIYADLAAGKTFGIFQLEEIGATRATQLIRPTCFDDIRALVALNRPGAIEHIDAYAKRSQGREEAEAPHPLLEETLAETHGLVIYQEQAMQVAIKLAGFTPSEADALRKAIGKKKPAEMAALRARFLQGTKMNKVSQGDAVSVWQTLEAHAGYSFNRAHATCYALISYATAWYAHHHPAAWLSALCDVALLLSKPQPRLIRIAAHAALHRIPVLPPAPLKANATFALEQPPTPSLTPASIRAPLNAIPGWGHKLAAAFLAAVEAHTDRRRPKADRIAECLATARASPNQKAALIAAAAPNRAAAKRMQDALQYGAPPPEPSWPLSAELLPHDRQWNSIAVILNALPINGILERIHRPDPGKYLLSPSYRFIGMILHRSQRAPWQLDIGDSTGTLRMRPSNRDTDLPDTLRPGTLATGSVAATQQTPFLDCTPLAEALLHAPPVLCIHGDCDPTETWSAIMPLLRARAPGPARVRVLARIDLAEPAEAPNPVIAVTNLPFPCAVDEDLLHALNATAPSLTFRYHVAPEILQPGNA